MICTYQDLDTARDSWLSTCNEASKDQTSLIKGLQEVAFAIGNLHQALKIKASNWGRQNDEFFTSECKRDLRILKNHLEFKAKKIQGSEVVDIAFEMVSIRHAFGRTFNSTYDEYYRTRYIDGDPLFKVLEDKDTKKAREMLVENPSLIHARISRKDPIHGASLFLYACANLWEFAVEFFIHAGANIHCIEHTDHSSEFPLKYVLINNYRFTTLNNSNARRSITQLFIAAKVDLIGSKQQNEIIHGFDFNQIDPDLLSMLVDGGLDLNNGYWDCLSNSASLDCKEWMVKNSSSRIKFSVDGKPYITGQNTLLFRYLANPMGLREDLSSYHNALREKLLSGSKMMIFHGSLVTEDIATVATHRGIGKEVAFYHSIQQDVERSRKLVFSLLEQNHPPVISTIIFQYYREKMHVECMQRLKEYEDGMKISVAVVTHTPTLPTNTSQATFLMSLISTINACALYIFQLIRSFTKRLCCQVT